MFLHDLTWIEAEPLLTDPKTIVVLPLGAAAKEHGPHLRLDNDRVLAEYWAKALDARAGNLLIAPTLTYHFYPAFTEYPGSTSLSFDTAKAMTLEIVRSFTKHGARKIYVINTGVSTIRVLASVRDELAKEGIDFRYTDLRDALAPVIREVSEQEGGTHADEIETSIMLVIAPDRVDQSKAVKDYVASDAPGLSRDPTSKSGAYSPTGTWGDPTLANTAKGKRIVDALLDAMISDLDALKEA